MCNAKQVTMKQAREELVMARFWIALFRKTQAPRHRAAAQEALQNCRVLVALAQAEEAWA